MIVINVYYDCKPGKRREFYESILPKAEYFRQEAGNIQYAYFDAIEDDNRLLLVEKWADEESLKSHASTDIFKSLGELKEKYVDNVVLEKFDS
ncbi:MAG: antibiotic biosynthesis monooxygenase [Eubacterium sp.]|nr:antibiotic biosynthesis monooxygenase [Eubacterium sp.]